MTVAAETRLQIKNTRAFINAKPDSIVLTRHTKVRNVRAGATETTADLDAQTFRVDRAHPPYLIVASTRTDVGRINRHHDRLLALPDADLEEGDTFTWEDDHWRVTQLRHTTYEITAVIELL